MSRAALWFGFVGVHIALSALGLLAPGWPLGDVQFVYSAWTEQAESGLARPGIDSGWVYPILAFLPLSANRSFSEKPAGLLAEVLGDDVSITPDEVAEFIVREDPSFSLIDLRPEAEYRISRTDNLIEFQDKIFNLDPGDIIRTESKKA